MTVDMLEWAIQESDVHGKYGGQLDHSHTLY
jgi:hypothetical protein